MRRGALNRRGHLLMQRRRDQVAGRIPVKPVRREGFAPAILPQQRGVLRRPSGRRHPPEAETARIGEPALDGADVAMPRVALDARESLYDRGTVAFKHLREPFGAEDKPAADVRPPVIGDRSREDFADPIVQRATRRIEPVAAEIDETDEAHKWNSG